MAVLEKRAESETEYKSEQELEKETNVELKTEIEDKVQDEKIEACLTLNEGKEQDGSRVSSEAKKEEDNPHEVNDQKDFRMEAAPIAPPVKTDSEAEKLKECTEAEAEVVAPIVATVDVVR